MGFAAAIIEGATHWVALSGAHQNSGLIPNPAPAIPDGASPGISALMSYWKGGAGAVLALGLIGSFVGIGAGKFFNRQESVISGKMNVPIIVMCVIGVLIAVPVINGLFSTLS